MLASTTYPDELLADFQQTYRIDLWGTDWERLDEDRAAHLAALAYQLPPDSRVMRAIAPAGANDTATQLLREIEHNQRLWHWAHTNAAKGGTGEPERITLPGEDAAYESMVEREERNAERIAASFGLEI